MSLLFNENIFVKIVQNLSVCDVPFYKTAADQHVVLIPIKLYMLIVLNLNKQ